MYIARYASLPVPEQPCLVSFQPALIGKSSVDFFPGESVVRNTLAQLGDTLIIRVKNGSGTLLVTEYQLEGAKAHTVDLRIDRIDTSEAILRRSANSPVTDSERTRSSAVPLKISGHFQQGSAVAQGGSLGEPQAEQRLEGFCIDWPGRPEGVDLAYSCHIAGTLQPAVTTGHFLGTIGTRLPITAIAMALIGPRRADYQLNAWAAFSGLAPQPLLPGQECVAPANGFLTALHVSINPGVEMNACRYQSPWDGPVHHRSHSAFHEEALQET
ncbi:hypothetical protein RSA46_04725 [Pseudomonas oryzihabitans]|nr:hypothetical protein SB5_03885 [Pseudomonas psychrotolerans]KTT46143.1 hypothetical protein RSA46_04725 [Pseudomonas psychrotolerans]